MSLTIEKRAAALILSILITAALLLSPALDTSLDHDETCCGCECLICLVSTTLTALRHIAAAALFTAFALLCPALIAHSKAKLGSLRQAHTLVILKTEILS